jgi:predicted MFS family arabinose efflux permease
MDRPYNILFLAVAQTILWAGLYYLFPALFARWELNLGFSKTAIASAFTSALIISSLLAPLVGNLIDKGHGQKILIGSSILGAAGLIVLSFSSEFWVFFLTWSVIGIALSGCLYEPCFAYVTKVRGTKAKDAIIFITLIAGFAGTVSFPVANIFADFINWQASARLFAFVILLFVVPILFLSTKNEDKHSINLNSSPDKISNYKLRDDLIRPEFSYLFFSFFVLALAHGMIITHIIPLLIERNISNSIQLLISASIGPMQVLGRIIMIILQKQNFSINIISTLTFLLKIIGTVFLIYANDNIYFLILFVIFQGSGAGMTSISRAVVTANIMGYERFGSVSGAMSIGFTGGTALSSFLGAQLWEWNGYDFMLKIVSILLIMGFISFVIALKIDQNNKRV